MTAVGLFVWPGPFAAHDTGADRLTATERAGLSRLPRWERGFWEQDLPAQRVSALPRVVPAGGVALAEPGTTAVWLYLQPAVPGQRDLAAAAADAREEAQVGGDIIDTVFGRGTVAADLVPAGEAANPSSVLNTPVWVVTIRQPKAVADPLCGRPTAPCGPAVYTSYVTAEDAVTGRMLAGFLD